MSNFIHINLSELTFNGSKSVQTNIYIVQIDKIRRKNEYIIN
jgi:hypothetical protein